MNDIGGNHELPSNSSRRRFLKFIGAALGGAAAAIACGPKPEGAVGGEDREISAGTKLLVDAVSIPAEERARLDSLGGRDSSGKYELEVAGYFYEGTSLNTSVVELKLSEAVVVGKGKVGLEEGNIGRIMALEFYKFEPSDRIILRNSPDSRLGISGSTNVVAPEEKYFAMPVVTRMHTGEIGEGFAVFDFSDEMKIRWLGIVDDAPVTYKATSVSNPSIVK